MSNCHWKPFFSFSKWITTDESRVTRWYKSDITVGPEPKPIWMGACGPDGFSSQVHQKPLIAYKSFSYDKLLDKMLVIFAPRTRRKPSHFSLIYRLPGTADAPFLGDLSILDYMRTRDLCRTAKKFHVGVGREGRNWGIRSGCSP